MHPADSEGWDGAAIADVEDRVITTFENLDGKTRGELSSIIEERLSGFNPAQAVSYGLTGAQVTSWLDSNDFDR